MHDKRHGRKTQQDHISRMEKVTMQHRFFVLATLLDNHARQRLIVDHVSLVPFAKNQHRPRLAWGVGCVPACAVARITRPAHQGIWPRAQTTPWPISRTTKYSGCCFSGIRRIGLPARFRTGEIALPTPDGESVPPKLPAKQSRHALNPP